MSELKIPLARAQLVVNALQLQQQVTGEVLADFLRQARELQEPAKPPVDGDPPAT